MDVRCFMCVPCRDNPASKSNCNFPYYKAEFICFSGIVYALHNVQSLPRGTYHLYQSSIVAKMIVIYSDIFWRRHFPKMCGEHMPNFGYIHWNVNITRLVWRPEWIWGSTINKLILFVWLVHKGTNNIQHNSCVCTSENSRVSLVYVHVLKFRDMTSLEGWFNRQYSTG